MQSLEAHFGSRLFVRHAHGLTLTDRGERLWRDSRDAFTQLERISGQFRASSPTRQQIDIRANISYASLCLPAQLKAFSKDHPEVNFNVQSDIWEPAQASVNVDIQIGYREVDALDAATRLTHDLIIPVVAPNLACHAGDLPLIQVAGYYQEWAWWLEHHPDSSYSKRQQLTVDNSVTAYRMAAAGLGVAMGRSSLMQAMLDNRELQLVDSTEGLAARDGFYGQLTASGAANPLAVALHETMLAKQG